MYLFMFKHRIANEEDQEIIKELMESSINQMLGKMLNSDQLEAAKESMGLDTTLIKDKTYFLIFSDNTLVGSGGYSTRKTLFGGNHTPNRSDDFLTPGKDAAKVRAMYTHPKWVRKGIGSLILKLSEKESLRLGFRKCELMATVSGILLYEKRGYVVVEEIEYLSRKGNTVPMYKMEKEL